jgi:hypothetical protein
MTARVYKIEGREAASLLAPIVTLLQWAVALAYVVFGISLIVWGWALSPVWCVLALGYFCLRKLGRR